MIVLLLFLMFRMPPEEPELVNIITTIHSVFYLVFREIKNKHTGIDITIPRFTQEKGLLQSTYEYQVVVVSNLPYFKSPKHKESDTVQFMVNEVKLEIIKIFQSFSF